MFGQDIGKEEKSSKPNIAQNIKQNEDLEDFYIEPRLSSRLPQLSINGS